MSKSGGTGERQREKDRVRELYEKELSAKDLPGAVTFGRGTQSAPSNSSVKELEEPHLLSPSDLSSREHSIC